MRVAILSVFLILFLSGCSAIDLIDTRSETVERSPLNLSPADPVNLSDPTWIVITEDNAADVFEYLKSEGYDPVIMGLTDSGYERLSIDFARIREHINIQRNVLIQYKDYYESSSPEPAE